MVLRLTPEQMRFIFRQMKFDKKKQKWKGITRAMREFEKQYRRKISRPTIYALIKAYPLGIMERPRKGVPKYFEEFERTEIAEKIKAKYWDAKLNDMTRHGKAVYGVGRRAWKERGKKDLMYFDEEDYTALWGTPTHPPFEDFVDPQTNKIGFNIAVALRVCMGLAKRTDLLKLPIFTTKYLKREKGRRKKWYLDTEEIIRVIGAIRTVDTLLLFFLGILTGGRFSALKVLKVADIDFQARIIDLYEPKRKKRFEKPMNEYVLEFIRRYLIDFNIKGKLFKWSLAEYNKRFKEVSRLAGLPEEKTITTHMMKHTCITQMSLHGVDIDVIAEYTGTDAGTILAFYRGGGDKKIRAQILGLKYEYEPWHVYIENLMPLLKKRYEYIKPYSMKVDGIRLRR